MVVEGDEELRFSAWKASRRKQKRKRSIKEQENELKKEVEFLKVET